MPGMNVDPQQGHEPNQLPATVAADPLVYWTQRLLAPEPEHPKLGELAILREEGLPPLAVHVREATTRHMANTVTIIGGCAINDEVQPGLYMVERHVALPRQLGDNEGCTDVCHSFTIDAEAGVMTERLERDPQTLPLDPADATGSALRGLLGRAVRDAAHAKSAEDPTQNAAAFWLFANFNAAHGLPGEVVPRVAAAFAQGNTRPEGRA